MSASGYHVIPLQLHVLAIYKRRREVELGATRAVARKKF